MAKQQRTIYFLVPTLAIAALAIQTLYGIQPTSTPGLLTLLTVASVLFAWRRAVRQLLVNSDDVSLQPEELGKFKPLLFAFFGFYLACFMGLFCMWYFQQPQLVVPLCAAWLVRKEFWILLCANRWMKIGTGGTAAKPAKPWLTRWLSVGITFYLALCGTMYLAQRSLIFVPSHENPVTKLSPWLHDDRTIGYCREVPEPQNVWLMMHGNAGQAAMRDYVLPLMSVNDSLYVLEYPGYGSRPGQPSRQTFNEAASEAYRILRDQFYDKPINVLGESIGSGPASELARETQPPDKIVLVVPFDSLAQVAANRFFWLPVRTLMLDNWNNIDSLRSYARPVEIYGAVDDEVIPVTHARRLANQVKQGKLIEIEGGHNGWSNSRAVQLRGTQSK